MTKLKKPVSLETAFGTYRIDEQIGVGGAGTVYGGTGPSGDAIALKVLRADSSSSDKRRRFKNEIAFLSRCIHQNVVALLDHGFSQAGSIVGPFYVMKRYDGSLRDVLKAKVPTQDALGLFLQMVEGIEAAHLHGAVHRDAKPENFLWDAKSRTLAVADFGVASLSPEIAATLIETKPQQRLANFIYAAPEQRTVGARKIGVTADIYALGLMLNELFTGEVPHGQGHRTIGSVAPEFAYLDPLVAKMLSQSPEARPASISALKVEMSRLGTDMIAQQKISALSGVVVPEGEIDNPLAFEAPKIVKVNWANDILEMELDRPVNDAWVNVIMHRLGSYTSVVPPERFKYRDRIVIVPVDGHNAQAVINHFKQWLPQATAILHHQLTRERADRQAQAEAELRRQRQRAEEQLRVTQSLRI